MAQNFDIEQETVTADGRTQKIKYVKGESWIRKFLRVVLGSAIGFIIASTVLSVLSIIFLIAIVAATNSATDKEIIKPQSVLELTLNAPIDERAADNPLADLDLGDYSQQTIGLNDIVAAIKNAATDDNISGISLNINSVQASPASQSEIREAILRFKESGKFVYAYSNHYSQGAYYLASAADKIFLNPHGDIDFRGLAFQVMFYKGLMEKLDIDVQVVKCGKFKSAVEPYLLDKMSEANREQMTVLGNSIWNKMLEDIAASRNISVEQLNNVADSLLILNDIEKAVQVGMVDELLYPTNYRQQLRAKLELPDADKLNLVSLKKYRESFTEDLGKSDNKIAVIYAVGGISDGKGDSQNIGDVTLCQDIRRAYKDDAVKAIVLRVNSPGGSALASEIIWNEIENAKAAGKTVVTSMGDYAASGGYYISCNSDAIVAQANTLTGSIGVFGLIPSLQRCLQNKLGVTIDVAATNAHADAFNGFRAMTNEEYNLMQKSVDRVYDTFLTRVSNGRGLTKAQVDSIGQGRVWSGSDALQLGLVDKLGNMETAIALAAELVGIDNYQLVYYPQTKKWWEELFANKEEQEVAAAVRRELGALYPTYKALKQITLSKGVQARMPLEITIE